MRAVKLKKKDLKGFLMCSGTWGELWAPIKHQNRYILEKVRNLSQLDLTAIRTTLPFKKLLFPPKFSMFRYDDKGYSSDFGEPPRRMIFGMHPCDIKALLIMDEFFAKEYKDPYYYERRNRTAIIGLSCIPDEKCFCNATDNETVTEGFDLFLTDLGDFFLVWVGSSLGDDILRECPSLIDTHVGHEDLKKYIQWQKYRSCQFKMDIDLTGMPDIVELSYDSPVWEQEGKKCLSCGACTIVCPTCPCFNVFDEAELGKVAGERVRRWDSCQFREYSLVAGGHNFREARAERLKLRFIHKLQSFVGKFGKPACTGCGRCIGTCPVDIDIYTMVKHLQGEEVHV
jgi:sulfhydrogenase subunit beta (sulfur reductase)